MSAPLDPWAAQASGATSLEQLLAAVSMSSGNQIASEVGSAPQPLKAVGSEPQHQQATTSEQPPLLEDEKAQPISTAKPSAPFKPSLVVDVSEPVPQSNGLGTPAAPREASGSNTATPKGQTPHIPTNIFIAGVPSSWDDKKLKERFQEFGEVISTRIVPSRHFGFVMFRKAISAQAAIAATHLSRPTPNCSTLMHVSLSMHDEGVDDDPNDRIFVRGLPQWATKEHLRSTFAKFGTIVECSLLLNVNGQCKGAGFVQYATVDEASAAIEGGQTVRIENWDFDLEVKYSESQEVRQQRQERNRERHRTSKPSPSSTPTAAQSQLAVTNQQQLFNSSQYPLPSPNNNNNTQQAQQQQPYATRTSMFPFNPLPSPHATSQQQYLVMQQQSTSPQQHVMQASGAPQGAQPQFHVSYASSAVMPSPSQMAPAYFGAPPPPPPPPSPHMQQSNIIIMQSPQMMSQQMLQSQGVYCPPQQSMVATTPTHHQQNVMSSFGVGGPNLLGAPQGSQQAVAMHSFQPQVQLPMPASGDMCFSSAVCSEDIIRMLLSQRGATVDRVVQIDGSVSTFAVRLTDRTMHMQAAQQLNGSVFSTGHVLNVALFA